MIPQVKPDPDGGPFPFPKEPESAANVQLSLDVSSSAGYTHVDDWLDTPTSGTAPGWENYAKFVLNWQRMPAWMNDAYRPWMKQFQLFCDYKGKRYKVQGASRLGDLWLTTQFHKERGYELRVHLDECSKWGDKP